MIDVRCSCGKLLGRIDGIYELKCRRCKTIVAGNTRLFRGKKYDPIVGD